MSDWDRESPEYVGGEACRKGFFMACRPRPNVLKAKTSGDLDSGARRRKGLGGGMNMLSKSCARSLQLCSHWHQGLEVLSSNDQWLITSKKKFETV